MARQTGLEPPTLADRPILGDWPLIGYLRFWLSGDAPCGQVTDVVRRRIHPGNHSATGQAEQTNPKWIVQSKLAKRRNVTGVGSTRFRRGGGVFYFKRRDGSAAKFSTHFREGKWHGSAKGKSRA